MTTQNKIARQSLRKHYRQQRLALSPKQQNTAALELLQQCLQATPLSTAQAVACYLANDGEIDPQAIINYCWSHQKSLLLPVLHPLKQGHLVFAEWTPASTMKTNRYGIDEPDISQQKVWELADIDVLFLPLVAFDKQGNRLGMGGGYYDRTLAAINHNNSALKLFGLAHDCQQANALTSEAWDIPMHGVVTPSQFVNISH